MDSRVANRVDPAFRFYGARKEKCFRRAHPGKQFLGIMETSVLYGHAGRIGCRRRQVKKEKDQSTWGHERHGEYPGRAFAIDSINPVVFVRPGPDHPVLSSPPVRAAAESFRF